METGVLSDQCRGLSMRKLSILVALAFSTLYGGSALAADSNELVHYSCKLNAEKAKGWIPDKISLTFKDNKQLTRFWSSSFKVDLNTVKVIRYTEDFREIKYRGTYKASYGNNITTIHTITILPKHDDKITYVMKFLYHSNHYVAAGTCKKTLL